MVFATVKMLKLQMYGRQMYGQQPPTPACMANCRRLKSSKGHKLPVCRFRRYFSASSKWMWLSLNLTSQERSGSKIDLNEKYAAYFQINNRGKYDHTLS